MIHENLPSCIWKNYFKNFLKLKSTIYQNVCKNHEKIKLKNKFDENFKN